MCRLYAKIYYGGLIFTSREYFTKFGKYLYKILLWFNIIQKSTLIFKVIKKVLHIPFYAYIFSISVDFAHILQIPSHSVLQIILYGEI